MEDLCIVIDGRVLTHYPFGKPGFTGGTETYVRVLAKGLAERGHRVHVVAPDLEWEEQRGPTEWWWSDKTWPKAADVLVTVGNLSTLWSYDRLPPLVILASNGVDPDLRDYVDDITGVACFSQNHADLLCKNRPFSLDQCFVTGLGVDLERFAKSKARREPGRMLWGNDPARGLWHLLDIYDEVRKQVPEASLHVTYDFERQFERFRWASSAMAELMWDCKRRLETTPGIVSLGALSPEDMLREQMACHVHVKPSDPPNVGSQIHGMLEMELAAAGVPLVLSDIEAFPEVFGEAATILPLPNTLATAKEGELGRIDAKDWAAVTVDLMKHPKKWAEKSKASRTLAEKHSWEAMLTRWEAMLQALIDERTAVAA